MSTHVSPPTRFPGTSRYMHSGARPDLLDLRARDVDWGDIARHLAHIPRYNGACHEPYTVAQHSLLVADHLPDKLKVHGLLHDAHEAYIGDIGTPVQAALASLCPDAGEALDGLKRMLDETLYEAAGLDWWSLFDVSDHVHQVDRKAYATECRDLAPMCMGPQPFGIEPFETRIEHVWPAEIAFARLYSSFMQYIPKFSMPLGDVS